MPEEFLRLLLGGVGWGFGLMFARQGDIQREWCICHLQPFGENGASATSRWWTRCSCSPRSGIQAFRPAPEHQGGRGVLQHRGGGLVLQRRGGGGVLLCRGGGGGVRLRRDQAAAARMPRPSTFFKASRLKISLLYIFE